MRSDLVAAVRSHALQNYNVDGWDILVECWEDEDISGVIGNAADAATAIEHAGRILRMADSMRRDITLEVF